MNQKLCCHLKVSSENTAYRITAKYKLLRCIYHSLKILLVLQEVFACVCIFLGETIVEMKHVLFIQIVGSYVLRRSCCLPLCSLNHQ